MTTPIKFPQQGWARHRLKPVQRLRTAVSKLKAIVPQKKKIASVEQLAAYQRKYAKG